MKIGKQPKRAGGPSQKFLERKAAEREAAAQAVPATGAVRLYLDDERRAPEGWTLVRTGARFRELAVETMDRLEAVSLDWYLGGPEERGTEHANWLAGLMLEDPAALPALQEVYLHSSDHDRAREMARTIEKAVPEDRDGDIWVMIGSPDASGVTRSAGWR